MTREKTSSAVEESPSHCDTMSARRAATRSLVRFVRVGARANEYATVRANDATRDAAKTRRWRGAKKTADAIEPVFV